MLYLVLFRVMNAIGIPAIRISMREAPPVLVKNASVAAPHIVVERVSYPIGDNISVAGSSFNVSKKTIIPPDKMPGIIKGRVTLNITIIGVFPKEYAASSSLGLTCKTDALIDPILAGINNTIYEKINSHID